jgi:hypothetical protein
MDRSEAEGYGNRIAKDVKSATGIDLLLIFAGDDSQGRSYGDQWWDCETFLNGEWASAFGTYLPSGGEAFVAYLADYLQEDFSQTIWGGWPICPDHKSHPLEPVLDDTSTAVWKCPKGRVVARIGELPPSP